MSFLLPLVLNVSKASKGKGRPLDLHFLFLQRAVVATRARDSSATAERGRPNMSLSEEDDIVSVVVGVVEGGAWKLRCDDNGGKQRGGKFGGKNFDV